MGGTGANLTSLSSNSLIKKGSTNAFEDSGVSITGGQLHHHSSTAGHGGLSLSNDSTPLTGHSILDFIREKSQSVDEIIGEINFKIGSTPQIHSKITGEVSSDEPGSEQGRLKLSVNNSTTSIQGIMIYPAGETSSTVELSTTGGFTWCHGSLEVGNVSNPGNDGDIVCAGDVTSFDNSSDIRLKTNIEVIEDPLIMIKKLRGVRFNWNENVKEINKYVNLEKKEVGVIAQEVEKVLPEIIKKDTSGKYKAVNYEKLTPLLIECIKSQQSQIDDLHDRLSKIEKKIN